MDNNEFFALHITWTCYGTWLPGDPRGHVSNHLNKHNVYLPKQNIPGTDYAGGDRKTWENARSFQKGETVYLTAAQAELVCHSMVRAAKALDPLDQVGVHVDVETDQTRRSRIRTSVVR